MRSTTTRRRPQRSRSASSPPINCPTRPGGQRGRDGIREKDGMKLAPKVYFTANGLSARVAEAIQGYLRKIGVDWRLQAWDSTIAPLKMAEQDYEIWSVTVPYMSAGDLMN